jgi:flagellar basal body rod protein FlgG
MSKAKTSASILGMTFRLMIVALAAGLIFACIQQTTGRLNWISNELRASVATSSSVKFASHHTPVDLAGQTAGQHDLVATGEALDVAIQGDGFLKVRIPPQISGGYGYTRVGMLFTDKQGTLNVAIGDGLMLVPAICIPPRASNVEIDGDGAVKYVPAGSNGTAVAGRIHLTRFAHPQSLKSLGRGVFCQTPSSGEPIDCDSDARPTATLQQGCLEPLPELALIPRLGPPTQQGSLRNTGLSLDVGIMSSGWFHVRDSSHPDSDAYTRNGSMEVNDKGQLTIADKELIPPVTLPLNATHISIDSDGVVQYIAPGGNQPITAGQIMLWQFNCTRGLRDLGKGMYAETDDSGPAYCGNPGTGGLGRILQRYLETRPDQVVLKVPAAVATDRAQFVDLSLK